MELKDAIGIQIPGQGFVAETIQFWQFGISLGDTVPSRSVMLEGSLRLAIGSRSAIVTLGGDLETLKGQLTLLPSFLGLTVSKLRVFDNGLLEINIGDGRIETHDSSWELWGFCTAREGYANMLEGRSGGSQLKDYGYLLERESEWRLF